MITIAGGIILAIILIATWRLWLGLFATLFLAALALLPVLVLYKFELLMPVVVIGVVVIVMNVIFGAEPTFKSVDDGTEPRTSWDKPTKKDGISQREVTWFWKSLSIQDLSSFIWFRIKPTWTDVNLITKHKVLNHLKNKAERRYLDTVAAERSEKQALLAKEEIALKNQQVIKQELHAKKQELHAKKLSATLNALESHLRDSLQEFVAAGLISIKANNMTLTVFANSANTPLFDFKVDQNNVSDEYYRIIFASNIVTVKSAVKLAKRIVRRHFN